MAQQRLYTEEQVREMLSMTDMLMNGDLIPHNDIIASFTPIELPSDEEIDKHSTVLLYEKYPHHPISDTGYWKDMFFEGAKWMKQQILNQKKQII